MRLLTDQELGRFLDEGYLILELDDVPEAAHDALFEEAQTSYAARDLLSETPFALEPIGDNIVARMPLVRSVIESPIVEGALTSVLGPRFYRYSHSFIHASGATDQGFHKDAHYPWGLRAGIRSHRPNWAMLFYYPQTTTAPLGATEIVPGTTYWNVDHENVGNPFGEDRLELEFEREGVGGHQDLDYRDRRLEQAVEAFDPALQAIPVEVPKGSVVLVHFDLFHRGSRTSATSDRFMFKFWYTRTTEPRGRAPIDGLGSMDQRRHAPVVSAGNWLTRRRVPLEVDERTWEDNEAGRVARAYQLGVKRPETLFPALLDAAETPRRAAMYGLTTSGSACFPAAIEGLKSETWGVRKSCAFLLGEVGLFDRDVVAGLEAIASADAKSEVRSTAITALARIARRSLAEGQDPIGARVLNVALGRLDPVAESDMPRSLVPMNRVRQAAALAILNLVTEATALGRRVDWLDGLADRIHALLKSETDRYAAGTLTEVLNRLALDGDDAALEIVVAEFSHSRWVPSPPHSGSR